MEEYQQCVIDEKKDLDNKIERLIDFISGNIFKEVSIPEQRRLIRQKGIMELYSDVLNERITQMKRND